MHQPAVKRLFDHLQSSQAPNVASLLAQALRKVEEEIANFEYEFNEIVLNQLADLDPQNVIDMETIKEILLLKQQRILSRGGITLLRSKRVRHPEAYNAYREALNLDTEE